MNIKKPFESGLLEKKTPKMLLEELSYELSLNKTDTEKLVQNTNIDTTAELKLNLLENKARLTEWKLEQLLAKIKQLREAELTQNVNDVIQNSELSKNKLKLELGSTLNLMTYIEIQGEIKNYTFLEKYLPKNMIFSFKNPEKFHQQLGWMCLWAGNSLIACSSLLKKIIYWILTTFPDLYAMFKWEAIYERTV